MPELPEVEHMTRLLSTWLGGARVVAATAEDPTVLDGPQSALTGLTGAHLVRASRRAKLTVATFSDGTTLVVSYRMTGKLVRADLPSPRRRRIRLRLAVADRPEVWFDDTRRLGRVHVVRTSHLAEWLEERDLGPDPWPQRRTAAWWREHLGQSRRAIKPLLLDPSRVAGIGNIGASESLWRAGIDPRARACDLEADDWSALAASVPAWIERTLQNETKPEIDFVTQGGENPFWIYGRRGGSCPRCGQPLEAFKQGGRTTFWCSACVTQGRRGEP